MPICLVFLLRSRENRILWANTPTIPLKLNSGSGAWFISKARDAFYSGVAVLGFIFPEISSVTIRVNTAIIKITTMTAFHPRSFFSFLLTLPVISV